MAAKIPCRYLCWLCHQLLLYSHLSPGATKAARKAVLPPLLVVSPYTWAFQITTAACVPPLLFLRRWSPPAAQPGCCSSTPWPQKCLLPFSFFAVRAMSMDYWHVSFIPHSGGIAKSTRCLGTAQTQLRCSVAGSPGTSCLHGEVKKGSSQFVCLYLTPISTDECSSPPGTAEKQWYFRGGSREDCAQFNIWKWSKAPPTKTFVT